MKTAVFKTDLHNCETPEVLYEAVMKLLMPSKESTPTDVDLKTAYRNAKTAIVKFRQIYSKLPSYSPSANVNDDATAGLQEIADWCIDAIDIVNDMILEMDIGIIEKIINLHKKLKDLPETGFPAINDNLFNKAKQRAQKIVDKYSTRTVKNNRLMRRSNFYHINRTIFYDAAQIISNLQEVADKRVRSSRSSYTFSNKLDNISPLGKRTQQDYQRSKKTDEAFTEIRFYKAVEKICRILEETYANGLIKLEKGINDIFEHADESVNTLTGDLLGKYDKLSGLELWDRFERIVKAHSIDSLAAERLFGPNRGEFFLSEKRQRKPLVDSVVETLENIKGKIEQQKLAKATKKTPKGQSNKQEPKFKPWTESGNARFVVDDNRILFHHNNETKDLRLGHKGRTYKLLRLFAGRNPLSSLDIKSICTSSTRPSDLKKHTNEDLNKKINREDFPDVPDNVEFVKYDTKKKVYGLWPKILHHDDLS